MILRQYQSLGSLPELIVFSFLLMSVATFAFGAFKIQYRDPVIVVPNATGSGALAPAAADEHYIRSFATNFLANWTTWNEYTYQYRRSVAISMMTPSVRDTFAAQAQQASGLMRSLSQSESYMLREMTVKPLDPTSSFVQVSFSGDLSIYYGGVGGAPEPFRGALLLRSITPAPGSPLCLEVFGILIDRNQDKKL